MKNNLKYKTCCLTGHTLISVVDYDTLRGKLTEELVKLIKKGVIYFGTGGNSGYDKLASITILNLKKKYPHIKLIIVLPYPNYDKFRGDFEKWSYQKILKQADKVTYFSDTYTADCIARKNRHMVDSSGFCIGYCRRSHSNTSYTMKYAMEQGLEIVNIANYILNPISTSI